MARPKRCAAIGFSAWFLVAFMACGTDGDSVAGVGNSRQTIRVARKGGQSGMEGSCLPAPEPRPFSADDVRALIEGTRATTLAYRAARRSPGSSFDDAVGLPMTVKVELQGEPRIDDTEPFEHCVFAIEQDVEVTLSFAEPALDIVIEATADAFSSTFAVIVLELGSDVARALGLPPRDVTTFSLAFDEGGIEGTFEQDECGRAVFPASVRCPDWSSIEVDLDRQRPGLRALPALSALVEELGDVPLEWSDGTQTTLAVSLTEAPEWACSGVWVETFCPENLQIPVSIRAVTADGRLDAELPAELEVGVATETSARDAATTEATCGFARTAGEIESWHISAYFDVAAGGSGQDVIPPLGADTGFSLIVRRTLVSPDRSAELSPDRSAEIRMLAIERRDLALTPPIDATIDPAGRSCVVLGAFAEVESP